MHYVIFIQPSGEQAAIKNAECRPSLGCGHTRAIQSMASHLLGFSDVQRLLSVPPWSKWPQIFVDVSNEDVPQSLRILSDKLILEKLTSRASFSETTGAGLERESRARGPRPPISGCSRTPCERHILCGGRFLVPSGSPPAPYVSVTSCAVAEQIDPTGNLRSSLSCHINRRAGCSCGASLDRQCAGTRRAETRPLQWHAEAGPPEGSFIGSAPLGLEALVRDKHGK